jgi:pSer/pThr/pTyr-binding forkhead associated (FHA) protein
VISLALLIAQGIFLILLYVFLFWVIRIVLSDLRRQVTPRRLGRVAPGHGQLVVLQGERPARGEEFLLQSNVITMGRDPANELVLSDRFASGQHARIAVANGGYWIEDLGSKNGTFVNGERIESATPLNPGDRIEVGDTQFRFEGVL